MEVALTDVFTILKSVVGGIISGGLIVFTFLSRYQTKEGCIVEHDNHDRLVKKDHQLIEERFARVELQISSMATNTNNRLKSMEEKHGIELKAIRESTERQEKIMEKMADKVWK